MGKDYYTTSEVSKLLGVTDRTVRRRLESYFLKENNAYQISSKMLDILKADTATDSTGQELSENNNIEEVFTPDDYQEFQRRLIEYPILKKDLEYHKRSVESHQRQMEKILDIMHQRNLLEGGDKGYIPIKK
ncbi:hypothetical protein [Dokdonia sp. R78006]|uniref:hypothetical protein n=1 Tax=Dokdonia sp. R78006 TaxID=3093866 RepID=UPI0036D2F829